MRLQITPLAQRDLEEITDFIALDNPARAVSFIDELRAQCTRLCANPSAYRLRPDIAGGLRSCAYGRYVIFFDVNERQLTIVRILHSARDVTQQFGSD